ncbi:hypothetical protein E2562_032059 [Oryza meyeriana var. granulata]|uniref:Uncharacterized protein n=1 Tax=Oryza meyeriana var. granulata TaxID=110450 RepID=A0A6G1CK45_9ORYZ|nr:hypothetical protein E2562_032059 [Oryza meyeriana var. granulata]
MTTTLATKRGERGGGSGEGAAAHWDRTAVTTARQRRHGPRSCGRRRRRLEARPAEAGDGSSRGAHGAQGRGAQQGRRLARGGGGAGAATGDGLRQHGDGQGLAR